MTRLCLFHFVMTGQSGKVNWHSWMKLYCHGVTLLMIIPVQYGNYIYSVMPLRRYMVQWHTSSIQLVMGNQVLHLWQHASCSSKDCFPMARLELRAALTGAQLADTLNTELTVPFRALFCGQILQLSYHGWSLTLVVINCLSVPE